MFIAHSPAQDGGPPQPLFREASGVEAHAAAVARMAGDFAEAFGSGPLARWLGWWHDAGKVAPDVQAYLRGETGAARGPDHSSAGMLAAWDALQPLAFNVAGHHGGLMDSPRLRDREAAKRAEARVAEALATAQPILRDLAPEARSADVPSFVRGPLAAELWVRMLHSALVDADCLDTERWFEAEKHALRERDHDLAPLWDALRTAQGALIADSCGDVNAARAEVYRACVDAAELPPGVFRLTVPTGGGKTRSAMAFALRHALAHDLRRVIVALPYTSIIEQNADVCRALFRANPEAVLEHHSAAATRETPGRADGAELRDRLAAENWDAPIVVTTTVQLLESLFANKNSRLRKLHRVARSVVILDEVQTLPGRLLAPTLDMLRTLAESYGVTVLLCTATPPALAQREGFAGIGPVRDIIRTPEALFRRLKRVEVTVAPEKWTWTRASGEMRSAHQALAVLNTKKDALALLAEMEGAEGVFHLSTLLCGAHRRAALAEVRRRLGAGEPCRLVATQVIEAGVDVDFPLVLRARGPLDRVIQAAGRCNREGTMEGFGRVVVFDPEEGTMPPGEYATATGHFDQVVRKASGAPDFDDPALVEAYFALLYQDLDLDENKIQPGPGYKGTRSQMLYEQTAEAYRLIDDDAVPVVVDYDGPPEAVQAREDALDRVRHTGRASRRDFRALQPFVVSLRKWAHENAEQRKLCHEIVPGLWRWTGSYHAPTPTSGRGLIDREFFLTATADGTVI